MAPSSTAELVQVITGDGRFDLPALETLMSTSSSSSSSSAAAPASWAAGAKNDYQVVAIMGPQSSGKSTLMNYLVRWQTKNKSIACCRPARAATPRDAARPYAPPTQKKPPPLPPPPKK
jgi:hypothetical protein